ncbi:putative tRNA methyl transferase [Emiliania huxleyi CCMP1516]|uniref:tRNA-5-taurinomethyluridine 2-sulfurtransferase n=2 Tax=Emiliania huxleyi TaxID=2903 RepID=A0A0D3IH85_EMIH1|nr:putative tRNA methyl transferase [Emiliania huxleyi CCMP1516]EOD10620.1 putative tRNA methyl transferase [Emiliania huxleyi CCMP1516]|eukprot:XP_005763049.1 putative tRNA methyl transferase [Emiliania huxleyi CCMP1516]
MFRSRVLCVGRRGGRRLATVAVGVSGGVDSSVAALLLKRQGHDVVGVHMSNWDHAEEGTDGECAEREREDARRVCERLGIGFHAVSFVREYWSDVFEPFVAGIARGATLNPDVACNRHIKFDRFTAHALALGADWAATGHYARVAHSEAGGSALLTAVDADKDQTYFLAAVPQASLRRSLFPLGELRKREVRALAAAAELHTAGKRESMGICFVGKRRFRDFIRSYLPPQRPGPLVCVESGRVLGTHQGVSLYTHGQRARVGGLGGRWYVAEKCLETDTLFMCEGAAHPALLTHTLEVGEAAWISGSPPGQLDSRASPSALACSARVRHRAPAIPCSVAATEPPPPPQYTARFATPVNIAVGQTVALYDGCRCLGGAQVIARGPSLHEQGKEAGAAAAARGAASVGRGAPGCLQATVCE